MVRSSSSPASTPSRVNPPSRASAGGIVDQRGLDAVADVAQVVELGDERSDERRLRSASTVAHPGNDRKRLLQTDQIARPRRAERRRATRRSRSWTGLMALAELAAIGRPKRQLLDRVQPIADGSSESSGRSSHARSRRLPIDVIGPIELVEQRAVAAAFGSFEDLEMLERRRIDQQRVGALRDSSIARTCARSTFCVARR